MKILSYAKYIIYGLLLFVVWYLVKSIEQIEFDSPLETLVILALAAILTYPQKRSDDK